jgi:hypothetical protein
MKLPWVGQTDSTDAVTVDEPPSPAASADESKRPRGMGIKQHLVALAGIRHQPKCATGAQLHVGDLDASKQTADQQTFSN